MSEKKEKKGMPRKFDRCVIINELMAWSEKETSLMIAGFCAEHGYLPTLLIRLSKEWHDFDEAYQIAKMRIAVRRENLVNMERLNYGAYARYQKHYDPFLDYHEERDKKREAKRKKDIVKHENKNWANIIEMSQQGKIKQKDE